MATVQWTKVETGLDGTRVKLVKWGPLQGGDIGQPIVVADYNDKTVQFECANFGSGITFQGNIDSTALDGTSGAQWDTLNDPQGNPLSAVTDKKLETILEHPFMVRPNCAAGVVDATVFLLLSSVRG